MEDQSKAHLLNEFSEMRPRPAETEISETKYTPTEKALWESKERYRNLIEESFDGIFIQKGLKIIFANQRLYRMLGYQEGELEGLDHWLVYHPDYQPITQERAQARMRGEEVLPQYEVKLQRKDGTSFDGEIRARGIMYGHEPGIQVWVRDITERKRVEEQLKNERQKSFTLSENAPFGMLMVDADGKLTYMNPKFKELFGYDLSDIPDGRTWFRKAYPDPDYRHTVMSTWINDLENAESGEKRPRVSNVTCKDGTKKIINFIPVQSETGEQVISCEDITERKQAEDALREGEERYQRITEGLTDYLYTVRIRDGQVMDTRHSEACEVVTGYTAEEFAADPYLWIHMVVEEERDQVTERVQKILAGEAIQPIEHRIVRKDGQIRWVSDTIIQQFDPLMKLISYDGVIKDITERKQAESELRESEERYRTAIEHCNDGVALVKGGRHIYVNQKFLEIFGYDTPEEVIGKTHSVTVHPDDLEMVVERNRKRERGESVPLRYEFKGIQKDGTPIYIEISAARVTFQGESVTLAYFRDVTERKRLEEKLRTMSITDDLTGLYNRRGFLTLFQQQVKVAERTKENLLFLFADLDHMKWINDTLGHQAGDRALVETANILKETFRESDIIGRMGGDEFAVLAIGSTDENPEVLTARLRDNIAAFNKLGTPDYHISLSIGIVRYDPENPFSLDELLARADQLMYEDKKKKQN